MDVAIINISLGALYENLCDSLWDINVIDGDNQWDVFKAFDSPNNMRAEFKRHLPIMMGDTVMNEIENYDAHDIQYIINVIHEDKIWVVASGEEVSY